MNFERLLRIEGSSCKNLVKSSHVFQGYCTVAGTNISLSCKTFECNVIPCIQGWDVCWEIKKHTDY